MDSVDSVAGCSDTALRIEVVYGTAEKQALLALDVPEGTTALQAAQRSDVASQFPGLIIDENTRVGIFGQLVSTGQVLREGDRVEIYRPLLADPKEVRKARAARAKERRDGASDKSDKSDK
ncbi:MAG: RnfH family protein [Congregibacter sp.]